MDLSFCTFVKWVNLIYKENSERLFNSVGTTFKMQQLQTELFLKHKKESPYKMIICGDFNNTAFSYVYRKIKGDLNDAFTEVGNGFGRTYDISRRPINSAPDTFSDTKTNFSYRVALSYQPVKDFLTTYASVSSFFKPTRSQDTRTGKLFIPESGYQIEGGIKLEETDKLNVTLSGFYIKKNDLIIGHNSRSQVESATSTGIELDADAQPVKGLYLKLGYAFTNAYFDKYTPEPGDTLI